MYNIGMPKVNDTSRVLLITTVGAVLLMSYWFWKKRREEICGEFEKVGKITKLIIYPVKSLPGIEVQSAECTKLGLKVGPFRDRQWLIIKENGNFVHQRLEPTLALISLSFNKDQLQIAGPGMETLKLAHKNKVQKSDRVIHCRVWGLNIDGIDCGDEAAHWFNKYLNRQDLRFVQYVDDFKPRPIRRTLKSIFHNPGAVIYHDDGSIHILTESSIEDLNSRLKDKITYRNFRPNILVQGSKPYVEDNWKFLKSGTSLLIFAIPCGRCVMTTVNPDTGEKTEKDPLSTLKTYRLATIAEDKKKLGDAPLFGIYMGSYQNGILNRDDDISAISVQRK